MRATLVVGVVVISLGAWVPSRSSAAVVVFFNDLPNFMTAAGAPGVAISFDDIAIGTDLTGVSVKGITFELGNAPPPSAPSIVVRGQDTYTTSGFSGVIDPVTNKLFPTSGENVLSPGGEALAPGSASNAPGTNPLLQNDDLRLFLNPPLAAIGFDILFQSLDCCSFMSLTVYDASGNVLYSSGFIPTGSSGTGGDPAGFVFFGIVSTLPDIASILIDDFDDSLLYPDSNFGYDTFRFHVSTNQPPTADAGAPYVAPEGTTIVFDGSASADPDGDTIQYRWDFDDDGTWDTPWLPLPTASQAFGDDFAGQVRLQVKDDSEFAEDTAPVTVRNLAPRITDFGYTLTANRPRTQGYWNFQCSYDTAPSADHVGIQASYVAAFASGSRVFPWLATKADVCSVLDLDDSSSVREKAEQQLTALWLNVVAGFMESDSPVDLPALTGATSVMMAIDEIEDTLLSPSATDAELEQAKDVGDALNNFQGVARGILRSSLMAIDEGSDDGIVTWRPALGVDVTRTYYNGAGPDPLPSPAGLFPFSYTDTFVYAYFVAGAYELTVEAMDDDGGNVVEGPVTINIP